jgi:hypothetical protein
MSEKPQEIVNQIYALLDELTQLLELKSGDVIRRDEVHGRMQTVLLSAVLDHIDNIETATIDAIPEPYKLRLVAYQYGGARCNLVYDYRAVAHLNDLELAEKLVDDLSEAYFSLGV